MSDIRSHQWREVRARVLAEEQTCWLCGRPIDFDAAPRTRWSPSVDHIHARGNGGDPFDRGNLRAAHFGCNAGRGKRDPKPTTTSRRW